MGIVRNRPQHREHKRLFTTESVVSSNAPTQHTGNFLAGHLDMVLMWQSHRRIPENATSSPSDLPTCFRNIRIWLYIIQFVIIPSFIRRKRRIDDFGIHTFS